MHPPPIYKRTPQGPKVPPERAILGHLWLTLTNVGQLDLIFSPFCCLLPSVGNFVPMYVHFFVAVLVNVAKCAPRRGGGNLVRRGHF